MKRKKYNRYKIMVLGLIMIFLGISLLSYNYIKSKKNKAFENMNFSIFTEIKLEEIPENVEETIKEEIKVENKVEQNKQEIIKTNYIGMLEIPKISLKRGFTSKDSVENTIEKNVMILSSSDYPDKEKGNVILAAHSGNSHKSFFNNLVKLNEKDIAYIYYKNKKYSYEIVKIYKQERIGKIAIYRDYDKNSLTLITCTKTDNTTQTIYIAELIKIEEY